jgi:hypothetical protein
MSLGNGIGYNTKNGSATSGTVTSVGLTAPSIFSVGGSPVTVSGTLSLTLASQTANQVFAAPNGSAGAPSFRALVAADIPALPYGVGTVTSVGLTAPSIFSVGGSPVTASGTLSLTLASQTANRVFAAPNGSAGAPTFRALVAADVPGTWSITGNVLVSGNFLGSTNDFNLEFKRNNIRAGLITSPGTQNTFYGLNAGLVTTGLYNTFIGDSAGKANTTGLVNSGFGVQALFSNTTGRDNVGFGSNALYFNTSGNENLGIGSSALERNLTGSKNIGIGGGSGFLKTAGNNNVSIGHEAHRNSTAGDNNTSIGYRASYGQTGGSNNLAIGANTELNTLGASNQMNIANGIFGVNLAGSVGSPVGRIGIMTSAPNAAAILDIEGTGGGLLIPRMTGAQVALLALVAGNMVYNTTTNKHQGCNGATWNDFY